MVTVAEELPFVAAVYGNQLDTTCSNCFTYNEKKTGLKRCEHCYTMNYCSKECQQADWKFHKSCPNITVRIISRMIMRVKNGDLPVAFNGRTYDDLMDHVEEMNKKESTLSIFEDYYSILLNFMGPENVPPSKEALSIFGKMWINSFEVSQTWATMKELGLALYLGLSIHNHSCQPDCDYHFLGSKIVFRARDPTTKYSKNLTISYAMPTSPRELRRERLLRDYYFNCQCKRCMDEEEELLERSGRSICCPDGAVLPRENWGFFCSGQFLKCNKCGQRSSLTLEQINAANEELAIFCKVDFREKIITNVTKNRYEDKIRPVVNGFLTFFDRMERILSPYNLYLFQFAGMVRQLHYTVYQDLTVAERLHRAAETVTERLAPVGLTKVRHVFYKCALKNAAVLAMDCSRAEKHIKYFGHIREAHAIINDIYGSEHPLVIKMAGTLKNLKALTNSAKTMTTDNGPENKKEVAAAQV